MTNTNNNIVDFEKYKPELTTIIPDPFENNFTKNKYKSNPSVYNDNNSSFVSSEVNDMENIWLKQYIEQLDKDSKDFKVEMRERDQRAEQRMVEMEKRLAEQNKLAEERTNKSIEEIKTTHKDIKLSLQENERIIKDLEKQNRQFNIANFIAAVALVLTVLIGLIQINSSFISTITDLVVK